MITSSARTLLVIDDSPEIIASLSALLRPHYRVLAARTGEAGIAIASRQPAPDLILLDVVMPELDGYAVLARLKENPQTRRIPVIFLTALTEAIDEERGLELGACDYLTKPVTPAVLLARVRNHIEAKLARAWLEDHNTVLEAEVNRRAAENDITKRVTILALAHLAEMRDEETGNHILRTQNYVRRLAELLRDHPRFRDTLTDSYIDLLTQSAPLHDVGKVGIPDHVLLKPGKLSPEEWEIMKTHATLGADAIERAERDIKQPVPFLALAKQIARWHHEKWNGQGYPDGLAGDAIPISARLMALADVFDALISKRVYKPRMSFEKAREIIAEGRGTHFDPDMVDALLANYEQFVAIAQEYSDDDEEEPARKAVGFG